MSARSGTALKFLQWFFRAIEFACAAIILGIFSYFLATMHNHNLHIPTDARAVEGISGAATLYTLIALLALCCVAGLMFASLIAILLDLAFIGAFIYIAYVNRHAAGSCRGNLNTIFGQGLDNNYPNQVSSGFTKLPTFHTACRLQTACLAVSIIGILFFLFSIFTEIGLVRNHKKEKRFGPGPQNDYTSGYGSRGGFIKRLFSRRNKGQIAGDENILPAHTTPDQLEGGANGRHSYATGTTAAQNDHVYNPEQSKYETGYGFQQQPVTGKTTTTTMGKHADYDAAGNVGGGGYRGTTTTGTGRAGDGYNAPAGYGGYQHVPATDTTHVGDGYHAVDTTGHAGYQQTPIADTSQIGELGAGRNGYPQAPYPPTSAMPQQPHDYRYSDGVYDRT